MKILDGYILKKFLTTFFFVLLIILAVVGVIDYTEKIDDFSENNLSFLFVVNNYLVSFLLFMGNLLSPIAVFITAIFVTSRMASHNEIIAMLSGGMSFFRFMMPFIVGATILGLLMFGSAGWIMPRQAEIKRDFEMEYIEKEFYFNGQDVHFKIGGNDYAYLQSYDNKRKVGYLFCLEKFEGIELKEKIWSSSIVWDSVKKHWHLPNYTRHTFDGNIEKRTNGPYLDTVLNMFPSDFENQARMYEIMTIPELEDQIKNLQNRGLEGVEPYRYEKYERFSYPVAIILLTMMGVIVAARKSRRGTGVQIALGFALAFVYILLVLLGRSIGQKGGLDPMVSAWVPNFIFGIVTTIMYYTVPR